MGAFSWGQLQIKLLLFSIVLFCASPLRAENLHLIDQAPNGFAIYRSGSPTIEDFREWCRLGISEVMVLSGNQGVFEDQYAPECPRIKVIYEEHQRPQVPVTESFLRHFISWVEDARVKGKRILFRCNCGCHRTGRLAAFYEMHYMKVSYADAIEHMMAIGREMQNYPYLPAQVKAMDDFGSGRACSTEPEACVLK
jgi:hypothetical protein